MTTYIVIGSILALFMILSYFRNKLTKSKVINIIEESCTGCQLCIKKCRHKALEIVNGENGRHVVLKYPEKCTACKDCIAPCKFNALELIDRK